jgi:hypothetical protein
VGCATLQRGQRQGARPDGGLSYEQIDGEIVEEAAGLAPARGDQDEGLHAPQSDASLAGDAGPQRALEVVLVAVERPRPLSAEDGDPPLEAARELGLRGHGDILSCRTLSDLAAVGS